MTTMIKMIGTFVEIYDPTIEDSYRKHAQVDGDSVLLSVLDTAGQEEYKSLRDQHIRSGDGFLLVYSITEKATLDDATTDIFPQIQRVKDSERVPVVIIGNKCDLEANRVVQASEAKEFADKNGCSFMETSAKLKKNIDEAFYQVVRLVRDGNGPALNVNKVPKKSKCSIL